MSRTTRSYDEILESMTARYTSLSGNTPDHASDIGIRLKVLASQIFSLQTGCRRVLDEMFPQTATGEYLDRHAQTRGIVRHGACASSGRLRFSLGAPLWYDLTIAQGTVCAVPGTQDQRFSTVEEAVLAAGQTSVNVPAVSLQTGGTTNTAAQTITELVSPVDAVLSVTNPAPFIGASDEETDDQLRARLMALFSSLPNGSNAAFYREQALKFDGVQSVSVLARENGRGTVGIYAAGRGEPISMQQATAIANEMNGLRELNVDVSVLPAETASINVAVSVKAQQGVPFSLLSDRVRWAIQDWFADLSVGESVLLASLGNAVYAVDGVWNYALTVPEHDLSFASNHLPVVGTISVTEMGDQ